ncbi:TRAP transporter small permease [Brevibacterium sp. R8603A2]|uniref:TRAP transporter small permease n=1 Tax=Brevibacterium TaxID=1696 RepID=UPI001FFADDA4|nr:TRAP transporter small permease [Brevibacterium sp. R8603A2]MCK1801648.1 TRAP transporter small permease [Brevibacterium sp. R8603A2]
MLKFNQGVDKILSVLTAIALIVMMLHVVAHALLRYFFNSPIYGTNEIVAYWYLPMIALLGIPAAQLQKEHITVSLVIERMSHGTAAFFKVFAFALSALVSIGFAWFGFEEALENMEMGSTAGVTDIITWPVYFLVPLVFVVLAILFIVDIVVTLRTGDPEIDLLTGEHAEHDIEETVI